MRKAGFGIARSNKGGPHHQESDLALNHLPRVRCQCNLSCPTPVPLSKKYLYWQALIDIIRCRCKGVDSHVDQEISK
jgi:hypothetical protein